ncbi:YiiD C-terminal domain-containing protein [Endozoicomonas montiporae]|uniref:Thioesterase domain protein YiiD n=1 Tax=Endozoicomonas montiporae CL-33 TaxID=570277 RepID=A0A142BDI8_9GAMM|nr:YiiD C-terminal domain-containing protein [Endozoicomonas montiporae]AMO56814.1 thioesterase domain protein YiiD [Endozoicomonas montiporae CL-33]
MKSPQLTQAFADWVLEEIPLLRAMELTLDEFKDNRLTLSCPLAPNINDKGTAFGGSIATIATLCGWAFTMLHAKTLCDEPDAVIAEQSMQYLKPGHSALKAVCSSTVPDTFYSRLQEQRSARLELEVEVFSDSQLIATFSGLYVARPQR